MKQSAVIGRIPANEKPCAGGRHRQSASTDKSSAWKLQSAELPASKMPAWGWK